MNTTLEPLRGPAERPHLSVVVGERADRAGCTPPRWRVQAFPAGDILTVRRRPSEPTPAPADRELWLDDRGVSRSTHLRMERVGDLCLRVSPGSDNGRRGRGIGCWYRGKAIPTGGAEIQVRGVDTWVRVGPWALLLVETEVWARLLADTKGGRIPKGVDAVSPEVAILYRRLRQLARNDAGGHVLLTGPSGAGKEGAARILHRARPGARRDGFVAVNSSALNDGVVESELFGHAKGAFAGAVESRRGAFRSANGGVVFLDEVADLPPGQQAKILRAAEGYVRAVGSDSEQKIDVRIVAGTNADLDAAVAAGDFRGDLLARLSKARVRVPGIAERPEDLWCIARREIERAHAGEGEAAVRRAELLRTLDEERASYGDGPEPSSLPREARKTNVRWVQERSERFQEGSRLVDRPGGQRYGAGRLKPAETVEAILRGLPDPLPRGARAIAPVGRILAEALAQGDWSQTRIFEWVRTNRRGPASVRTLRKLLRAWEKTGGGGTPSGQTRRGPR